MQFNTHVLNREGRAVISPLNDIEDLGIETSEKE